MQQRALDLLTKAINAYLKLDPESDQRIRRLHNKAITIELLPFHLLFQLHFIEHHVNIQPQETIPSETTLRGTPLQLVGMLLNQDKKAHFFASDLIIEGNAELGQQVAELFDELHIDWEEFLAQYISDVPAYHVSRFARNVRQWFTHTKDSLTADINEYIHEEANWFPTREALADLFNAIDNTRMDIDRLEARIQHLQQPTEQEAS